MKRVVLKQLVKVIFFIITFVIIFTKISGILVTDNFNYQLVNGFFSEPEDSLDAVLIGASPTYTFWSAPLAWGKYGITVMPCAAQGMPFEAVPFFLKEAEKKHHDSLFIITINALNKGFAKERIHWSADYFPNTINKYQMIDRLSSEGGYKWGGDRLSLYIPFIQYKTRWSCLTKTDFHYELNGLKTGMTFEAFLETTKDLSDQFTILQETTKLSQSTSKALEETLDFCDRKQLNAIFILFPQCQDEETLGQYNEMIRIIKDRGYDCLNLLENIEWTGLDIKSDFYDEQHTNIHGCIKAMDYLVNYLVDKFDFQNKRGESSYASWDEAYESYSEIVSSYLTEEELEWVK